MLRKSSRPSRQGHASRRPYAANLKTGGPRRWHPELESLEVRNAPACGLTSGTPAVVFDCADVAETITISRPNATQVQIAATGESTRTYNCSAVTSITINAAGGNDTINVRMACLNKPVTINGGGGNDNTFAGSTSNSLDDLLGTLTVHGGTGTDELTLRDHGDTNTNTYTVRLSAVFRGTATVLYDSIQVMTLRTGTLGDTINAESTADDTHIYGGTGNDTFNVGEPGVGFVHSLDNLFGPLYVYGEGGTDALNIKDQGDTTINTYTLTDTTLTPRVGAALITFSTFESLNLYAGTMSDDIYVHKTPPNIAPSTPVPVTVYAGAGNDEIHVGEPEPAPSVLRDLNAIRSLTVHGEAGVNDRLYVYDDGDPLGDTYFLTDTTVTVASLPNLLITYGSTVEYLRLYTSDDNDGHDTIYVLSTAATLTQGARVSAGDGNDLIVVGTDTLSLSWIQSPSLIIDGAEGNNLVYAYDAASSSAKNYEIFSDHLVRKQGAMITTTLWYYDADLVLVAGDCLTCDDVIQMKSTASGNWMWVAAGVGNDTVKMVPLLPGAFMGNLGVDGGFGTNTLDYSAYTTTVKAVLTLFWGTDVNYGIVGIQNVIGGSANNILVGNDSSNVLTGGGTRDLLIGGGVSYTFSPDTLLGGGGEDILIAGWTYWDWDLVALDALMLEWVRPTPYSFRVAHLTGEDPVGGFNGGFLINATTVFYNDATGGNTLTGGAVDLDFFFGDLLADTYDWPDPAGERFISIS